MSQTGVCLYPFSVCFDSVVVPWVVGPVPADNEVSQRAGPSGERDAVSKVETQGPRFKTVCCHSDSDPVNIAGSALARNR